MEVPSEGDVLFDTETDGNKEVEVFMVHDERAGEHTIAGLGSTVAEYNDCDPDDHVIIASYVGNEYGTPKKYAFPLSRLSWDDPDVES